MNDDFNFSEAISVLFEINKYININKSSEGAALLLKLGSVLGLFKEITKPQEKLPENITNLIEARNSAKKNKDFTKADALKNELLALGIQLEDTRDGTRWKKIQ